MSALAHSVIEIMKAVKRLDKKDNNRHGNYDFTSVDDYKDFLRPLMAENGLYEVISQESFQIVEYEDAKGKKAIAQFDFSITLCHIHGEKDEPQLMTVALPFTGAQTSGAATSYAFKEWAKARFQMSSGDQQDEADLIEQSRAGLRLSKSDARELHTKLTEEFRKEVDGGDHEKLGEWWKENMYRLETLPKDWFINLRTDVATEGKRLKAMAELDGMTEEQLDALADNPTQQSEEA